ncbi:transposase, partial [Faecalicoccus pleomorphus]
FQTPNQMLAYAGLDPSRSESGEHAYNGHMVKHGSSHLRYVLLNCAEMVILHNPVFYDYYRKKREEGKHHRVALSHVARKLVRIIFFLEKNNVDYDPKKMR